MRLLDLKTQTFARPHRAYVYSMRKRWLNSIKRKDRKKKQSASHPNNSNTSLKFLPCSLLFSSFLHFFSAGHFLFTYPLLLQRFSTSCKIKRKTKATWNFFFSYSHRALCMCFAWLGLAWFLRFFSSSPFIQVVCVHLAFYCSFMSIYRAEVNRLRWRPPSHRWLWKCTSRKVTSN